MIIADDCSLLAFGKDPTETAGILNKDLERISLWANRWKVKFNAGKSKDVIFSNKILNNSPPLVFDGNNIERVNTHRHLGVYLSSNLDWAVQINDVCLKASKKLSVLRNVRYLKRTTLDMLYKITVRSVVDYALPVYANNLKLTEIARLDRLQYKAGKLVCGAFHYTSREKLNNELGWENFNTRIRFLGLSLFQKIHLHETRPLVRKCMSKLDYTKTHFTRSKGGYSPYPNFGMKFSNSFFPFMTKLWNSLNFSTQIMMLPDFKVQLKNELKPMKFKHFSRGSKIGNCLLTRIRLNRSDLNFHRFEIGLHDTPDCSCHATETSIHYLMDCFLYSGERQTLYNLVEHYIPNFSKISKRKQFEILLMGICPENPDFTTTNTKISIAVQNYIFKTKRFKETNP